MSFLDLCQQYFKSRNLYDILNVTRNATEREVKKAYHKLSLVCHPDRVDESEKADATEKFKILGQIHSILSNPEKRDIYNETGACGFDSDDVDSMESQDWFAYWRVIFKPVTKADIEKYEQEYKGSDEELNDLKRAYNNCKGDMDIIHETVPFMSLKEEERVGDLIMQMIKSGTLPAYDIFTNEPERKRDRRFRKLKKEEKDAIKREAEQQTQNGNGFDDLAQAIMKKRESTTNAFLSALEAKYSKPNLKRKSSSGQKLKK